jgi:hypothetical protein
MNYRCFFNEFNGALGGRIIDDFAIMPNIPIMLRCPARILKYVKKKYGRMHIHLPKQKKNKEEGKMR